MGFWSRLTGRAPASPDDKARAPEVPVPASGPHVPQARLALGLMEQLPVAPLGDALAALDAVLAAPSLDPRWLPRAAELVPQLVRLLKQEHASEREMVEHVSRDAPLAAEVIQLASSSANAARGPVQDLRDALQRIGLLGLHKALARTVLRPVFNPQAEPAFRAAQHVLQRHADWQAEAVACAAVLLGEDAFDGYVAGLLQGVGWQVLLRVLAEQQAWPGLPPDEALAAQLADRAHRLFGMAARDWELSPAFEAFAVAALSGRKGEDALSQAWTECQMYAPIA